MESRSGRVRQKTIDLARTARMGAFGFCYYGPLQDVWYALLARSLPVNRALPLAQYMPQFVAKVALNQLVLAPIVITSVFVWNACFTNALPKLHERLHAGFFPTLMTGWKFWVPAASLNFLLVPLQFQVLYMSSCGLVWSSVLSNASAVVRPAPSPHKSTA